MNRIQQIQKDYDSCENYNNWFAIIAKKFCVEDIADIYTELRDEKNYLEADKIKSWFIEKGFDVEIYKWGGIFITNHKGIYGWNYKGLK